MFAPIDADVDCDKCRDLHDIPARAASTADPDQLDLLDEFDDPPHDVVIHASPDYL